MTLQTYTIELRVDFDHDGNEVKKAEILKAAMKSTAREAFATAQLLCAGSKRKPQIAFHGGDFFVKDEEIEVLDSSDEEIAAQAEELVANPGVVKFFKVEAKADAEVCEYFEAPDLEHAKQQLTDSYKLFSIPDEMVTWSEVDAIPDEYVRS